ncbi:D-glycerate 3-kinase, chloroplastic isoform X2 [Brassica napus]|uniref:D-glycerate 3-kinase, chloroplastic isoform X2 n=1 Tax=Brassica napus TaxID=3708 RepID=UPI002078B236|nr:D-glycerate 3-kinase, chloroplastic isoform X2 [Brassica napus]
MAGATSSSLIWSPWQATLQQSTTNNNNRFYLKKGYPFPCHSVYNTFNFKRRFLSSSKYNDDHVVTDSSASSKLSPLQTHFSFSGCGCSWIQDNSMVLDSPTSNVLLTSKKCSALPSKTVDVSSVSDLFEFICSGPLVDKIGITPDSVGQSIDKWLLYGSQLCRLFQLNELMLTIPQKARLYHYYIPVFVWCQDQIALHTSKFNDGDDVPPLVIGFSAPQGCGKTTLVFALDYLFKTTKMKSATISIDDFYLTSQGQAKLREENSGNALLEVVDTSSNFSTFLSFLLYFEHILILYHIICFLQYRGNAGSHDLPFSVETIEALTKLTKDGMKMKVPRYDKSAYSGRGDRADATTWPEVEGPLKVVLFEGWMLGFKPLPAEAVKAVDPQLETVNKNLEAYYEAWDKYINAWVVIKIKDPSYVYRWRLQAEIAMRQAGKPGMSDDEVNDFVSRYLPAYKAYLPTLYAEGPSGSDLERVLAIDIDEERNPILAT